MIETDLIRQAQLGNQEAWTELMRLHQTGVFRLAYLHLGDAAEAEDVAQECFVRAYRSLPRFDIERPLRPWLLRIASNLASNRRRSAGRYWAALQRAGREQPLAQAGPERTTTAADDANELWAAVRRLPVKMQTVLYLRYFLDLSVEEVAAALDAPTGTVKSQTHRALARLQDVIRTDFPSLRED